MRRVVVGVIVASAGFVGAVAANGNQPPVVTHFSLSPSSFPATAAGVPGGTTFRFRLSEPATVTIAIARRQAGRMLRGRCVKPTAQPARRRACVRYVSVGRIVAHRMHAGRGTLAFSGRLGGRALGPSRYRATIVAIDRRHRRSKPRTARLRIVTAPTRRAAPPAPAPTPDRPAGFPNPSTAGVPAGWTPSRVINVGSEDYVIDTPGAVYDSVLFDGGNRPQGDDARIRVAADNVTFRRSVFRGVRIDNELGNAGSKGTTCRNGMLVEDSTFTPPSGFQFSKEVYWAVGTGGYTLRRVAIRNMAEGLRVGGLDDGCGPVAVEDSFIGIAPDEAWCKSVDWHGDGIQGYGGNAVSVRNVTIELVEPGGCGGTAPFFYPRDQGNTRADVDRLLVIGGGFSFRDGMPGTVRGLKIADGSWHYGPFDVNCPVLAAWEADVVTITSDYQPAFVVRSLPCNGADGA